MASEIRVDKINSLSGVGTVTLSPTGVDISGITTAATLKVTTGIVTTLTATTGIVTTLTTNTTRATTGIVTTLTATTGIVTTLTTNTLTANSTAKVGSGVTLSPDGDVFVTGVTTSSTVKVGGGVTISESGIEASGIGITCANINGTQIGGRRNMIINGAMTVAQRGTPTAAASYTSGGYGACDRWRFRAISTDEADFVISQESDAPTASGLTKSIKIKTNTVESALASDEIFHVSQRIEAQDLQHLKYGTSSALPVTLSFWVKAYQTGTYAVNVYKPDTSNRQITATYTISASNTWEFKTMTFPGDTSGGGIADDTGTGLQIYWLLATGTDYTGTTSTSWANYANGGFANGQAVNIMSSTDNYFYLTGVQFEVGSQATAFEHRSFGEEMNLCRRYFYMLSGGETGASLSGFAYAATNAHVVANFPVEMRTAPSYYGVNGTSYFSHIRYGAVDYIDTLALNVANSKNHMELMASGNMSNGGYSGIIRVENTAARIGFDAEL